MNMDRSGAPVRTALVTGATGFVGSNLVHDLVANNYSVICLVRKTSDTTELEKLPVRLILGDLSDSSAIQQAVRGVDTIFHTAGAIKAIDRANFFRINQAGTRQLLEITAAVNPGLSRFVHISSLAAAGPSTNDCGLTENAPPNPISWYGESKLASEKEVLRFADVFPVTIIRPSAVYGPRDRETLMIFRMIKRGCLFTPGRFIRRFSLIYVHDLTRALIRAGECSTPSGEVFYISRPEIYTWDDVGRTIAGVLQKKYRRIAFPEHFVTMAGAAGDLWMHLTRKAITVNRQKVRELLQPSWICDASKAIKDLGFNPNNTIEEGMRNTVLWYKNKGWL
jgi:nucleoside-diphosphate-sugar epimerase